MNGAPAPRPLRLVIASPGDVQAERDRMPAVVEEINGGIGAVLGLRLELIRYETDGHPGFHPEGPQGLLDPILRIEDSDIVVGIFWKRFGTPTRDSKSGTEDELRRAWGAWQENERPQVMIYFNEAPYKPKSPEEALQWASVLQFQEELPRESLWWPYTGPDDFTRLVRNHLTRYLRHNFAPESVMRREKPQSGARSFAVLPFRSLSRDEKWDSWREALTEELITSLRSAQELRLVDRGSTARYKGTRDLDPIEVGRELEVDVILWGSYQVLEGDGRGDRIIFRARLVDTHSGEVLDTFKEEGELGFEVQARLVEGIMGRLGVQPVSPRDVREAPTTSLEALDYVRIGIHHFDAGEYIKAENALGRALALDPDYSDAHYHLGLTFAKIGSRDKALAEFQSALGKAYDRAFGKLLWSFRTGWKVWAEPAADAERLYIGSDGGIFYALDKTDGTLAWQKRLDDSVKVGAAVAGGRVLAASERTVYALAPKTGETRWKVRPGGRIEFNRDLVAGGETLYVGTSHRREAAADDDEERSGTLVAIEIATGKVRWRHELEAEVAPALPLGDRVAFGSADGGVHLVDGTSGETVWRTSLPGPVRFAPACDGQTLYFLASDTLYALDADSGEVRWEWPGEEAASCAPLLHDHYLYLAFGNSLSVLDCREEGAAPSRHQLPKWIHETAEPIGSISVGGGLVFITSRVFSFAQRGRNVLRALDRETGHLFWQHEFGDSIYGAPHLEEGVLYLGNRNHVVYAFNIEHTGVGRVRSAQIWNEIGRIHASRGRAPEAISAFESCLAVDPTFEPAQDNLISLYREQGRVAKAIETQQSLVTLLTGEDRERAERALGEFSGLEWIHETGELIPFSLLPILGPLRPDEPDASPIVPGPAVGHGLLLCGTRNGDVVALNASDGAPRWERGLTPGRAIRSTPCVAGGMVFVGTADGQLSALEIENGAVRWQHRTGGRIDSTPIVVHAEVLVGSDDGNLYALDVEKGDERWRHTFGNRVKSSPAVGDGIVCAGAHDGRVYAVEVATGKRRWEFETGDIRNSSAAYADGRFLLGPEDGTVYALDAASGKLIWRYKVEERTISILKHGLRDREGVRTFGFLPSSPAVADGRVYVGSNGGQTGHLYALDLETGRLLWRAPVEPSCELGSPAVAGQVVFTGAGGIQFHDRHVYALSVEDGSLLWKYETGGDVLSRPVLQDDRLFVWSMDGSIYAFELPRIEDYTPERDADFYVRQARVRADANDPAAALAALEEARRLEPKDADVIAGLADTYEALGDTENQRRTLEEFQRLEPSATHTYWRLGGLYLRAGRVQEGVEQLESYVKTHGEAERPLARYALGTALMTAKGPAAALREFDRAIREGAVFLEPKYGTDQDTARAATGLLYAFGEKALLLYEPGGNLAESLDLDLLERAAAAVDDVPPAYDLVQALLAEERGAHAEAAARLEEVRRKNPEDVNALSRLGVLYHEHLRDYDKAYSVFAAVLEQNPADPSSKANVAEAALSAGSFAEAARLASEIFDASDDAALLQPARAIRSLALLFAGERREAAAAIRDLAQSRRALGPAWRSDWGWSGTRRFIEASAGLDEETRRTLLLLLDFAAGEKTADELEAALPPDLRA